MSAEVIEVNFRTKEKVQKYVVSRYVCFVCKQLFVVDSRNTPTPLIKLGSKGDCICKQCSVDIHNLVVEEKWNK